MWSSQDNKEFNKERTKKGDLGEYTTHINESKELKCWYKPTAEYSINKTYNFQGKPNKSIFLLRLVYAKKKF